MITVFLTQQSQESSSYSRVFNTEQQTVDKKPGHCLPRSELKMPEDYLYMINLVHIIISLAHSIHEQPVLNFSPDSETEQCNP